MQLLVDVMQVVVWQHSASQQAKWNMMIWATWLRQKWTLFVNGKCSSKVRHSSLFQNCDINIFDLFSVYRKIWAGWTLVEGESELHHVYSRDWHVLVFSPVSNLLATPMKMMNRLDLRINRATIKISRQVPMAKKKQSTKSERLDQQHESNYDTPKIAPSNNSFGIRLTSFLLLQYKSCFDSLFNVRQLAKTHETEKYVISHKPIFLHREN